MDLLIAIVRNLLKHRFKLMVMPLMVMGLLYYFTANMPSKYKTDARLFLNLQEGKGVSLTDEDLKQYQVHTYFQNTIELLKSKKNSELVQLKLIETALTTKTIFSEGNEELIQNKQLIETRLREIFELGGFLDRTNKADSLMINFLNHHHLSTNYLRDLILAFRVMDSNFIKLELSETTAERAKILANLFIQSLIEENRKLAKNKVKGHKDIIEGLVRQAKADLDEKIKRLEKYKLANNIINLGEHTKAIVTYLVQLEGQRATLLTRVMAGQTGKKEVVNSVRNGNELSLDLSSQKEILDLKKQLVSMNRQLLQTAFNNSNTAEIEIINANITSTQSQIQNKLLELARKTPFDPSRVQLDLVSKYVSYDLEEETSADMVGIINSEIERVTKYSSRFAPFESTIGAYEQEISTAQNVYLVLLNKLNLTQSMEYGSGENVIEVVDPPYLPTTPEPSKRMILIISGGLAMAVLMMGFLIVVQLMDATVSSVETFERVSFLNVVGAVPKQKEASEESLTQAVELIRQQQLSKLVQQVGDTCTTKDSLVIITSAQSGEGTAVLAKELQNRLTSGGKKVAVLDANWMENETEGFLSIKPLLENHGVYHNQSQIHTRIEDARSQNDVVIIVTAPLNLTSDGQFWLKMSATVVHAFKANRIYNKVDKRTETLLLAPEHHFLGAMLMDVDIENMEDYLGEIPRKRSTVRKFIKKLLNRNFK